MEYIYAPKVRADSTYNRLGGGHPLSSQDGPSPCLSKNEPHLARAQLQHLDARQITKDMNGNLVKKALEKVLNPNVLVNLVSQRVRQLNSGGGGRCRPLVADVGNLGAADIALLEIIEDKMGWELAEVPELTRPSGKNRRRPQHWAKS